MASRRLHLDEIRDLPNPSKAARERALEALNLMRARGLSLTAAAYRVGTTRETMLKYAGRALEKNEAGEWVPKPWDRIIRPMRFPTPTGVRLLAVRDSRSASKIARYWAAVREFLLTGNEELLRPFRAETVQVEGEEHSFVTDPDTLMTLATAGEVRFEDLYGLAA